MSIAIVLDSTPLGLLTQRAGVQAADECRNWLAGHSAKGDGIVVPEIVDYELRRELLRSGKTASIVRLDRFTADPSVNYLKLTTEALHLAAELWARVRKQGFPLADPHALDVDVIMAAQILAAGYQPSEFIVATSNVDHLARLVPAAIWNSI